MAPIQHVKRSLLVPFIMAATAVLLPSPASASDGESSVCEGQRLITTDGYGEVRVAPDSLRMDVGAEARATTLEQARSDVNSRMQAVLQSIRGLGIEGLTLQTAILQVSPVYAD